MKINSNQLGSEWKAPVRALKVCGSAAMEPSQVLGDAWLATQNTTWNMGDNIEQGRIYEWDGMNWKAVTTATGGVPDNGMRVIAIKAAGAPFDGSVNDYLIYEYNTTTSSWEFETPTKGMMIVVTDKSIYTDEVFVYAAGNEWITPANAGGSSYSGGAGIEIDGTIITAKNQLQVAVVQMYSDTLTDAPAWAQEFDTFIIPAGPLGTVWTQCPFSSGNVVQYAPRAGGTYQDPASWVYVTKNLQPGDQVVSGHNLNYLSGSFAAKPLRRFTWGGAVWTDVAMLPGEYVIVGEGNAADYGDRYTLSSTSPSLVRAVNLQRPGGEIKLDGGGILRPASTTRVRSMNLKDWPTNRPANPSEEDVYVVGGGDWPMYMYDEPPNVQMVTGDIALYRGGLWIRLESVDTVGIPKAGLFYVVHATPGGGYFSSLALNIVHHDGLRWRQLDPKVGDEITVAGLNAQYDRSVFVSTSVGWRRKGSGAVLPVLVDKMRDDSIIDSQLTSADDGDSFVIGSSGMPLNGWAGFASGNIVQYQPSPKNHTPGGTANPANWAVIKASREDGDSVLTSSNVGELGGSFLLANTVYRWTAGKWTAQPVSTGDQLEIAGSSDVLSAAPIDFGSRKQALVLGAPYGTLWLNTFGITGIAFDDPGPGLGLRHANRTGPVYSSVGAPVHTMDLVGTADIEPSGGDLVNGRAWVVGTAWGAFDTGDVVEYNEGNWNLLNAAAGGPLGAIPRTYELYVIGASPQANDFCTGHANTLAFVAINKKWVFTDLAAGDGVGVVNRLAYERMNLFGWTGAAWERMPHLEVGGGLTNGTAGLAVDLSPLLSPACSSIPGGNGVTYYDFPTVLLRNGVLGLIDGARIPVVALNMKSDASQGFGGAPVETTPVSYVVNQWDQLKTGTGDGTLAWDAGNSRWVFSVPVGTGTFAAPGDIDKFIYMNTPSNALSAKITLVINADSVVIEGDSGSYTDEADQDWYESTYQDQAIYTWKPGEDIWVHVVKSTGLALPYDGLMVKIISSGAVGGFQNHDGKIATMYQGGWDFRVMGVGSIARCEFIPNTAEFGFEHVSQGGVWVEYPTASFVKNDSTVPGATVADALTNLKPSTGTADPTGSVTPAFIGAMFINTNTGDIYVAIGATSAEWVLIFSPP